MDSEGEGIASIRPQSLIDLMKVTTTLRNLYHWQPSKHERFLNYWTMALILERSAANSAGTDAVSGRKDVAPLTNGPAV